jgi:excisionase family DNA binding protein
MTDERVETPKQLAARVNLSEKNIRRLIKSGELEHVMIGCRAHIPVGAFTRFLEAKTQKVKSCQDAIKAHDCAGSPSVALTTSPGLNAAAAASARLVRQTANKLKASLQSGCTPEGGAPAQVIRLRS